MHHVLDSTIRPLIFRAMDGYRSCFLTFGPSGGGKSFAASAAVDFSADLVFKLIAQLSPQNGHSHTYRLSLSMVEIYRDVCYDLLSEKEPNRLKVRQDGKTLSFFVEGATQVATESAAHFKKLIAIGRRQQKSSSQKTPIMLPGEHNPSRSHILVRMQVNITSQDGSVLKGELCIAELAGPHRQDMFNLWDQPTKVEMAALNKSISSLSSCFQALVDQSMVVPFRDSTLTRVLEQFLNRNAFFTVFVCLSPANSCTTETERTLTLCSKLKEIYNQPARNLLRQPDIQSQLVGFELDGFPSILKSRDGRVSLVSADSSSGFEADVARQLNARNVAYR